LNLTLIWKMLCTFFTYASDHCAPKQITLITQRVPKRQASAPRRGRGVGKRGLEKSGRGRRKSTAHCLDFPRRSEKSKGAEKESVCSLFGLLLSAPEEREKPPGEFPLRIGSLFWQGANLGRSLNCQLPL